MNSTWNRESVLRLIELYEERDVLYFIKNKNYLNRDLRAKAYEEIYNELKNNNINVSKEAIKLKIHTLRNQYLRELRLIENSKKSGAGVDEIYKPKLWCFQQLKFLNRHCITRPGKGSIEVSLKKLYLCSTIF